MANEASSNEKQGLWRRLWSRPRSKWLLGIPIGAFGMFFFGAMAVIGSEVMIHLTGSEDFCASACHSMKTFTTPEWKDSPHYSNPSGVRATCSDCHIPHVYPQLLIVKAKAGVRDAYYELTGKINTREKYEAHRAEMAERVWAYMKATDSRECRSCHKEEHFALPEQGWVRGNFLPEAVMGHESARETGETCIDCHKGIAHKTPDEIAEEGAASRQDEVPAGG